MNTILPKVCGADIELGNFIVGDPSDRGYTASRALLREIAGFPRSGGDRGDPQDWGRRFLPGNGGCAYIDLDHIEVCLPEVVSAYDHVACWHAMLRITRVALQRANQKQPAGRKIQVLVNNSDGLGNSYGSHLNFLLRRKTWDDIFNRKLHWLLYLASYQVSSIIYTGQGKAGSENGASRTDFQIAQRADFFETLTGTQTTFNRPLVNSRDEPLCGAHDGPLARLHVIFFDNTLCQVSSLLKVGVMQLILAGIETGSINPDLILDDPLDALAIWSRDLSFQSRARTASGREVTAVEHQFMFLEELRKSGARGAFDGAVPRAGEILDLLEDTLSKLRARDMDSLAPRLDWVLKWHILKRALELKPELTWQSREIKYLDHIYSSLDPSEGLYWIHEARRAVETVVAEDVIERFISNPPEDTRAWTRAMLLRFADYTEIDSVNWDSVQFRIRVSPYWLSSRTIRLPDPLAANRESTESAFQAATDLVDLLDRLEESTPEGGAAECRQLEERRWHESSSERGGTGQM